MKKTTFILFLNFLLAGAQTAFGQHTSAVPFGSVNDPSDLLSPTNERIVSEAFKQLESTDSVIFVVTIVGNPDVTEQNLTKYSESIISQTDWQSADSMYASNGYKGIVYIFHYPGIRKYDVLHTKALGEVVNNRTIDRLTRDYLVPKLKSNDFSGAYIELARAYALVLSENESGTPKQTPVSPWLLFGVMGTLIATALSIYWGGRFLHNRRVKREFKSAGFKQVEDKLKKAKRLLKNEYLDQSEPNKKLAIYEQTLEELRSQSQSVKLFDWVDFVAEIDELDYDLEYLNAKTTANIANAKEAQKDAPELLAELKKSITEQESAELNDNQISYLEKAKESYRQASAQMQTTNWVNWLLISNLLYSTRSNIENCANDYKPSSSSSYGGGYTGGSGAGGGYGGGGFGGISTTSRSTGGY